MYMNSYIWIQIWIHINFEFIWFFHIWIHMFHEVIYEFGCTKVPDAKLACWMMLVKLRWYLVSVKFEQIPLFYQRGLAALQQGRESRQLLHWKGLLFFAILQCQNIGKISQWAPESLVIFFKNLCCGAQPAAVNARVVNKDDVRKNCLRLVCIFPLAQELKSICNLKVWMCYTTYLLYNITIVT